MLGDLTLDVVLSPAQPLARGTDVPGMVRFRQGGSAATAAAWLGRLGARRPAGLRGRPRRTRAGAGRVAPGRPRRRPRHAVLPGVPTGRIGVVVDGRRRALVRGRSGRGGSPRAGGPASRLVQGRRGRPPAALFADRRAARVGRPRGDPAGPGMPAPRSASTSPRSGRCWRTAGRRRSRWSRRSRPMSCWRRQASSRRCSIRPTGRSSGPGPWRFAPVVIVKRGGNGATVHLLDATGRLDHLRRRDQAAAGQRHDRRRRRVRRGLPDRLRRRPADRPLDAGRPAPGRPGRPSRRRPPARPAREPELDLR